MAATASALKLTKALFSPSIIDMNNLILTNKKREKYFKEIFVNLIYDNMAMEDEAIFSKKNIAERYKLQIDNLIKEGVHNKIVIPNSYYVKDKAVLSRN
ncbi:MAG: hypothetical protein C0412_08010 [Flavobacterium sp.]|nr:hypothetical protein [Flavobacterium sp.]